jgi:acyl-CoA thioesterase FadM
VRTLFRTPIKQGSVCILRAKVDSIEGRKLRMSATLEDAATGQIQVESTTLFVFMKLTYFQQLMWYWKTNLRL